MSELLFQISLVLLATAMLLGFYRMAKGPTVVDRILAFDAVVLCTVGFTSLLSRWWRSEFFIELILIVSSLGFFGTVAFVFFLEDALPASSDDETENQEDVS